MHKNQVLFIIGLIFAILVAIFAMTNANPVTIKLFFYEFEASQALIIFFSAALGAIIMALLGTVRYVRRLSEIKRLRKEIQSLKKEIQFLEATENNEPHITQNDVNHSDYYDDNE